MIEPAKQGRLDEGWADGVVYSRVCPSCDILIGGCVVGGASPYKTVDDAQKVPVYCFVCGSRTELVRVQDDE